MGDKTYVKYDGLKYGALHYKGTIENTASLPSSGNEPGDCYRVISHSTTYAWLEKPTVVGEYGWFPLAAPIEVSDNTVFITDFSGEIYGKAFDHVVKPATPVISPSASGVVNRDGNTTVTITCSTSGATIQYSTNGGTSWITGSSFTISQDDNNQYKEVTVKARATKLGQTSDIASQDFKIQRKLSAPTISNPDGDEWNTTRSVTVTGASGSTIYYTTNDTAPSTSSSSAASPATVELTQTTTSGSGTTKKVRAIQGKTGWATSGEATAKSVVLGRTITYTGWFASDTIAAANITSLTVNKKTSVAGSYTIPNSSIGPAYIYFCFPTGWNIGTIKSGGFDVPMTDLGNVGSWHVYRTGQTTAGGTFVITA